MSPLAFTVFGRPQPAGSKRAFIHKHTGKPVVVDDAKHSRSWKQEVRSAAVKAMDGNGQMGGPLVLSVAFMFARPKGHLAANGTVKPSAPAHHIVRPDTSKLLRCAEDAMTGVIYRDDAQIVAQHISKCYAIPGEPERCDVEVHPA